MAVVRVTVTLPEDVVHQIDQIEKDRNRFVLEAVEHEFERRRRVMLRRSLENPHPESELVAEIGFDAWAHRLPRDRAAELVDWRSGKAVRWLPGRGWTEADE